jgi:hypothetical protein
VEQLRVRLDVEITARPDFDNARAGRLATLKRSSAKKLMKNEQREGKKNGFLSSLVQNAALRLNRHEIISFSDVA